MNKPLLLLLCAILPAAVGCDDKAPETTAATEVVEEAPAAKAPEASAKEEPPAPESRGWSVTVTGVDIPPVTGNSVMAMDMPGFATYRMTNPRLMGIIDLTDTKVGQEGKFTPYSMSLNFIEEQMSCGMSSTDKDPDLTLTINKTAGGLRGEFRGKVTCAPLAGGERKPATITGWFEK